jgi:hypothetical protein
MRPIRSALAATGVQNVPGPNVGAVLVGAAVEPHTPAAARLRSRQRRVDSAEPGWKPWPVRPARGVRPWECTMRPAHTPW